MKVSINEILTEREKSKYWLAKQCDISQNNMIKICNGKTSSIRFETIDKICSVLECTPNDIFGLPTITQNSFGHECHSMEK